MDIVNLLISLLSGVVGGNVAGAAAPSKSLGVVGNSLAGVVGGGVGNYLLQILGVISQVAAQPGTGSLDISSIVANIASSGVGGAVLMLIVGYIKAAAAKK